MGIYSQNVRLVETHLLIPRLWQTYGSAVAVCKTILPLVKFSIYTSWCCILVTVGSGSSHSLQLQKRNLGKTKFGCLKINIFYPPKEEEISSATPKHTSDIKVDAEDGPVLVAGNHSIGRK